MLCNGASAGGCADCTGQRATAGAPSGALPRRCPASRSLARQSVLRPSAFSSSLSATGSPTRQAARKPRSLRTSPQPAQQRPLGQQIRKLQRHPRTMLLGACTQPVAPLRRCVPLRTALLLATVPLAPPRLAPQPLPAAYVAATLLRRRHIVAAMQAGSGGKSSSDSGGEAHSARGGRQEPKGTRKAVSGKAPGAGGGSKGKSSGNSKGTSSSTSGSTPSGSTSRPKRPAPPGAAGGSTAPPAKRASKGLPSFVLTSRIKGAASLEQLEQLEAQHGHNFDYINTAAAISQLGQWAGRGSIQPADAHPLLRRLARRLEPLLSGCGGRELANIVWAWGKCAFSELAPLLSGCLAQLASDAAAAEARHLSNALYGAALLREHGYSIDSQQAGQLLAGILQQQAQLNGQDVSNTLWAAAVLGLQLPERQVKELVAALVTERERAAPQALANTLWAAATLEAPLPSDTWAQLLAALAAKAARGAPQDWSNSLWAAAKQWGDQPERRVADALLALVGAVSQQQVAAMNPQHIANSLWALATLCLGPQPLTQWLAGAALQRLPGMKPQEVSNTALALAKLGLHDARVFGPLAAAAAEQQAEEFGSSPQHVSNFAWAVAVADQRQLAGTVAALAQRLAADSGIWSSAVPENLKQLHQVHLWLADAGHSSGLAGALSPQQLAQCAAVWDANLAATAEMKRSDFERRVFAAARRLSGLANCRQEARTPDGAFSVDVVATHTASGLRLAIEADGPTHFLQPGRSATGDTLARNRALAARGYVVVGVPYWQFYEVWGGEEKEAAYLEARVEAAVKAALAARDGGGGGGGAAPAA